MDSQKRNSRFLAMGIGQVAFLIGLSGCIPGSDRQETDGTEVSASSLMAPAAARQGHRNPGHGFGRKGAPGFRCCPSADHGTAFDTRILLTETWDRFDSALWDGDGDQWVADGLFTAIEGAESAAAGWAPGEDGALGDGRVLRFSNELVSAREVTAAPSEREALFFLSGDDDGSYSNYLFVFLRYSVSSGTLFLDSFGAAGGVEFDQSVVLPWTPPSDSRLVLDVEIDANAYRILLDGEAVDEITLSRALNRVTLFEVGVQIGPEGDAGLIDRTIISLDTPRDSGGIACRQGGVDRPHGWHRPGNSGHWRAKARMAKTKLEHCARPSRGLKALARFRK